MTKSFYISVLAIIQTAENVLVIHKTHFSDGTPCDIWNFPGGKMEAGETEIETLKRELFEELGYKLSNEKIEFEGYVFPGGVNFCFKDGPGSLNLIYKIKIDKPFDIKFSSENESYKWLSTKEFLDTKFFSIGIKPNEIHPN